MEKCKYYKDDFCTNADSPCVADWCPCTECPELCKYYKDAQNNMPSYDELYEYWLKTKDKSKRKPRKNVENEQLPGQLNMFDIIDNI